MMKWLFDRLVAFVGLVFLWPVLLVVWVLIHVKMPGGPREDLPFLHKREWGRMGSCLRCISSVA